MTRIARSLAPLATAAVALSLLASPAPAAVQSDEGEATVIGTRDYGMAREVSFADLNLTLAADVDRLSGRVDRAVRQVCLPLNEMRRYGENRQCRSVARDRAQPQIDMAIGEAHQLAAAGKSPVISAAILIGTRR